MIDVQDGGPRGRFPNKGEWGVGPASGGLDAGGGRGLMNVANAALRRAFFSCTSSFPLEVSRDRTHDSTDGSSGAREDEDGDDPRAAAADGAGAAAAVPQDLEFTREAPGGGAPVLPEGELPPPRQQPATQPGRCAEIDEGGLTLTIPTTRIRTGSPRRRDGQDGPPSDALDRLLRDERSPGAHDFDDDVSALTQSVCSGVVVGGGVHRHHGGGSPIANGLELEENDGGAFRSSPSPTGGLDELFPGPADPQGFPAGGGAPDAVGALPSPSNFNNRGRGGGGGRGGRRRGRRRPPPRMDRRRSLATIQSDRQLNMLLEQDGFGEI